MLFSQEASDEDYQKSGVKKLIALMSMMNGEELKSIFRWDIFGKRDYIFLDNERINESAVTFLKHLKYFGLLAGAPVKYNCNLPLWFIFERMVIKESLKKEGKNERLLSDISECLFMQDCSKASEDFLVVSVPFLLKVALNKDESEKNEKEMEIALLALSNIPEGMVGNKKMFFNETIEIIHCHQEHHYLTQLGYQSAWQFLIKLHNFNDEFEDVIMNKLHFSGEVVRELEDLMKNARFLLMKKISKDIKEICTIKRWLKTISFVDDRCINHEEWIKIVEFCVWIQREASHSFESLSDDCYELFARILNCSSRHACLQKSNIYEDILEELCQPSIADNPTAEYLKFLQEFSERLKEEMDKTGDPVDSIRLKRMLFDKAEEKGYEDIIISFLETIRTVKTSFCFHLSEYYSDYFVFL